VNELEEIACTVEPGPPFDVGIMYWSCEAGFLLVACILLVLADRNLLQDQPSTTTRPLAVRGNRRDPLNNFNKYRGGYDVKNKHYWAVRCLTLGFVLFLDIDLHAGYLHTILTLVTDRNRSDSAKLHYPQPVVGDALFAPGDRGRCFDLFPLI